MKLFELSASFRPLAFSILLVVLAGCSGGGGDSSNTSSGPATGTDSGTGTSTNTGSTDDGWQSGVFEPKKNFKTLCADPRPGTSDQQGSFVDENNWIRSWTHELYLWYDEVTDRNPAEFEVLEYFDLMKTFATTPSGNPKDQFHFTLPTEEWRQMSQSGVSAGYGATWSVVSRSPPRKVVVAYTDPNTPASTPPANLERGAEVLEVDGIDVVNDSDQASVDTLNAVLFPSSTGETHEFTVQDRGATETRTFTMESVEVTSDPVQNVKTVDTTNGPVGYMLFNDHIATSEAQLIDAVRQLRDAAVVDLFLDIRYNGGGFLDIANELAFMIAGENQTAGAIFEELEFNDKHNVFNPVTGALLEPTPFHTTSQGFGSTRAGEPLPSLGLPRVFVLTGPGTCSASESIINSLRGIDVQVIQVGSTTCGKPYGFHPTDNCGTTYFSIQFRGVNDKGFGDYADGFSPANITEPAGVALPGCSVADDLTHLLGDPEEGRFAAALAYRIDGTCPAPTGFGAARAARTSESPLSAIDGHVRKSPWLTNRILRR